MNKTITILNGPNLNLLGTREPDIYGRETLADIEALCVEAAQKAGFTVDFRQSNHEGDLIDWVQEAGRSSAGIIINAGGYTHTSVALHDALRAINIPIIEVHLSDPKTRESFRHHSFIEPVARQSICGLGAQGYVRAIEALSHLTLG
ncbi:MAG: type II 3-dehydroquinate dehydratase [Alphaproteobacteria bacterium]|nr:type II 3-dehydroquinate dehydratase [Alphaproteobacteria bacterium]